MEENLHDDKLDDYVRKSFDDYEEDPPGDMWDRVEVDLVPPAPAPNLRAGYLRWGWKALAAGVILVLFSTLVCEHLYYEEKLRVLSNKSEENPVVLPQNSTVETAPIPVNDAPGKSDPALEASKAESINPSLSNPSADVAPKTQSATAEVLSPKSTSSADRISKPLTNQSISSKSSKSPATNAAKASPNLAIQNLSEKEKANTNPNASPNSSNSVVSETPNAQLPAENPVSPTMLALDVLPNAPAELWSVNRPLPQLNTVEAIVPAQPSIKPVREASGWYLGAQISLLGNKEIGRPPVGRPGRPAFANKQNKAPINTLNWVQVGKKLNRQFSLETGLGYQKMTQKANHAPQFKFGEGFVLGSPFGIRRAFNYDLSTYGGSAEVSLRMEASPGVPPDDNEPVNLKISTEHRIELLRIPLLAKYQFGSGAWHGFAKAGILGNIVLKNELDIEARVSQNARFQPVSGTDGYTVQLDQKSFFLGFLGSAGLEYDLSKHLSLSAAPTFIGDFPRKDQYRRPLPQRLLVGINVGANYYF